MDLIINNGTVVTASDTYRADIGVRAEKIVQVGQAIQAEPHTRVINAEGKYVIPGGVDPHTHLDTPGQGTATADDYLTGTVAAACGGTTTIVNFCFQEKGKGLQDSLAFSMLHAKPVQKVQRRLKLSSQSQKHALVVAHNPCQFLVSTESQRAGFSEMLER